MDAGHLLALLGGGVFLRHLMVLAVHPARYEQAEGDEGEGDAFLWCCFHVCLPLMPSWWRLGGHYNLSNDACQLPK